MWCGAIERCGGVSMMDKCIDEGNARSTVVIREMGNSIVREARHAKALGRGLSIRHRDWHALTIIGRVVRIHSGWFVADHAVASLRREVSKRVGGRTVDVSSWETRRRLLLDLVALSNHTLQLLPANLATLSE